MGTYNNPSPGVEYVQECGRDGKPSKAILYVYPGCLLGHVSKEMKSYCKLDSKLCRRQESLNVFMLIL